jgi:tetratricopeptide (TPR) repeat protein
MTVTTTLDVSLKLVERDESINKLKQFWQDAAKGRGRVVLLAGEAGHGKSCLAQEIIRELDADPTPHKIARAACSVQSGQDEAFWPFAEVFSQLATSPRRKLTEDILDTLLDVAPEWIEMIPIAGNLVGASIKTAQVVRAKTKTTVEPNPDKMLREYTGALKKVSDKQPVLIFIDDLHWSDAASIKLLSHLSRNLSKTKALVIGAYRPSDIAVENHPLNELIDDLLRYDSESEMSLAPLSVEGVQILIHQLYSPNKFPKEFAEQIHNGTGGSPLFVVESLRLMQTQNEITRDDKDNKWSLAREWENDLPRSVEAVIHERIERLPDDLLEALTLASVQGAQFDAAVLAHVLEKDELSVMKLLNPAERIHGIVEYVGDVELDFDITARYRFASNLFHRELFERLRGKQKMLAHRKTAEGLDAMWPDDNEDLAAKLMTLYETGKVYDKAAFYAVVAARKCRKVGDITTAIDLLEDAEQMMKRAGKPNPELQNEIDESLSYLYEIDSSFDKAQIRAERVLNAGIETLSWRKWAYFQTRLARLADHDARFNDMIERLESVRSALEKYPDEKLSPEAFNVDVEFARALVRVSRADEAISHCDEAIARTHQIADVDLREGLRVQLDGALAMALFFNGQYDRCIRVAEDVLPVARKRHLVNTERTTLISLVNWCLAVGKYDRAKQHIDEMRKLGQETSSENLLALAKMYEGKLHVLRGEHEAALRHFDEADQWIAKFKSFTWRPELFALQAWSMVDLGRADEAKPLLIKASALARQSGSREWVAYVQMVQARLALSENDPQSALGYAETAEQIFSEENDKYDEARCERIIARCYRALDMEDRAIKTFDHAIELFTQLGNEQEIQFTEGQRDGKWKPG